MEAFQREGVARRLCAAWRQARLRGLYAEGLEPASESRAKCEATAKYRKCAERAESPAMSGDADLSESQEVRRMPALAAKEKDADVQGTEGINQGGTAGFSVPLRGEVRRFLRESAEPGNSGTADRACTGRQRIGFPASNATEERRSRFEAADSNQQSRETQALPTMPSRRGRAFTARLRDYWRKM